MRTHSSDFTRLPQAMLIAALFVCLVCAGGCYKRVVGVSGPGSDAYNVYEPNLKTEKEQSKAYTTPSQMVPSKKAKE